MKRKKIEIAYNPKKTFLENAKSLNISISSLQRYLRDNNLSQRNFNVSKRISTIGKAVDYFTKNHESYTLKMIQEKTGYSMNTIKKYLPFIESSKTGQILPIIDRKLTSAQIIKNYNTNQNLLLKDIITLHLGISDYKIELDMTYGKGNFYRVIQKPQYIYDKYPRTNNIKSLEEVELLSDSSIRSIMIDPCFLISKAKSIDEAGRSNIEASNLIANHFGSFSSYSELIASYTYLIQQASRLLQKGGVLIFKCMDIVSGGKFYSVSNDTINICKENNIHLIDNFILIAKHRMSNISNQKNITKIYELFSCF